uniref:S phase cyclin A-associated protein in the endoplasmic reticulum N-terminal domain-containing protein n=1 Tax=Kalanchoe fedtschenkoi TaxID=63787 RepID=A0A7N0VEK1_KALFE
MILKIKDLRKHRSSSKFSLQGWVSGSPGKQTSQGSQSVSHLKGGNLQANRGPNIPKPRVTLNARIQESPAHAITVEKEGAGAACLDDAQDTNSHPPLSKEIKCTFQGDTSVEVPQKLKYDVPHKIKWGDLDDELILEHGRKLDAKNNSCGDDQVEQVECTNPSIDKQPSSVEISGTFVENATVGSADLLSHDNSVTESIEIKLTVTSEDPDTSPQQVLSSASEDEPSAETVQEKKEVFSIDTKGSLCPQEVIQNNRLHGKQNHPELAEPVSSNISVRGSSFGEDLKNQASEANNCKVSTSTMLYENHGEICSSQKPKLPGESSGSDFYRETRATSSIEETDPTTDDQLQDDGSKSVMTSDAGDGNASESKERFRQRLWCFLFENLNRAVDELYLLCELECDVQQMKEAIIVLEEAASDFKDLNVRVLDFESPKRPAPEAVDGLPTAMMSDHRRPHALSWEVRRMTTSLHRAEILSSSLEAFKKIQKERNASYSTKEMTEVGPVYYAGPDDSNDIPRATTGRSDNGPDFVKAEMESEKKRESSNPIKGILTEDQKNIVIGKADNVNVVRNMHLPSKVSSLSNHVAYKSVSVSGKSRVDHGSSEPRKDKGLADNMTEKTPNFLYQSKINSNSSDKERERRNSSSWKTMDAWKEKRNWGDILSSPFRGSSRSPYTPGMGRKSTERARVLHDKLMSPDKRRKTAIDLKREAEEKHARALRIRSELETERVQKLQRTSEKLNRVNEWQADRSTKLREVMHARHQRSVSRHEAHLAQVVRRAGDESSKVNEVRFITSLNEENKKLVLRQKLHDSEIRRAEKLQVIKIKQKEDMAREEAVLERRKILEAEKLQRLAEIQRRKEEAQLRREEERKASSAAREAKAMEQQRKKEIRAKAQQEESELLAQKLAERLAESEQRRKIYLEQIRERASMDFRDQSSPLVRRSHNKDNQGRSTPTTNVEDCQPNAASAESNSALGNGNVAFQSSMKKRVKKIRQRLMALKHEIPDPLLNNENIGIGYRTTVGTARAKVGRWLQELQKLRQARKGAGAIGLIIADIIKYVDGKEPELHACRQAGLLDFIASALPASHSSKPDACLATAYFLRLLKVVLFLPANKRYFLAQNLLPPIIPMLAAAVENYTKIGASSNISGASNPLSSRTSLESVESISDILDGFLLIVTLVIGFSGSDECQLQMQEELVELVTAYQVIHRLRDLFALYDRPQVEGSPFPSSIILSINLLNVLTSRSTTTSSIDLDMPSFELVKEDNSLVLLAEYDESSIPRVGDFDHGPSPSKLNSTPVITVPDVADDRSIEENKKFLSNGESDLDNKDIEATTIIVDAGLPVAGSIKNVNSLKVTEPLKDRCGSAAGGQKNDVISGLKPPTAFLLSVISENGLVCLPSLLTAVLLQANNKQSSEQNSYVLPSNFEEVATGVLKVFNNLALVDIRFLQKMLSRPDLKMEFFHLMSFLLSHCTSNWKVATDQVGLLLIESLSLLGYFALFHPGNQAVLRWGKSPTILHKVCDLPFVFFSDPKLMPVLAGTLIASCYGCEQNKVVVQLELSVDMVISLLRSCKNGLPEPQARASSTTNPLTADCQKLQVDSLLRSSRNGTNNSRVSLGKNSARAGKARNQKESKAVRSSEDSSQKQKSPPRESCSPMMLHRRFPDSFLDKAEQFFSVDSNQD